MTPEQEPLLARQKERENDQQAWAEASARGDIARTAQDALKGRSRSQYAQLRAAPSISKRIHWLRQIAGTFAEAVAPQAACKAGCSACCHLPVVMSRQEAELIARETGAPLSLPSEWVHEPKMQYVGQACTFLVDARCAIYEHRPLPCRTIYNMDSDALLCEAIPGHPSKVPYANAEHLNALYVQTHAMGLKDPQITDFQVGDLREFFPTGLRSSENTAKTASSTMPTGAGSY